MHVAAHELDARAAYRLLIACLVPRPIAWIATRGTSGVVNLAPFSFFGGVTSDPPTVMVAIGRRRGMRKDTARNLIDTGSGVIHIPSRPLAEAMVASSIDAAPEVSELDALGLATAPCVEALAPRLADAAIAFEVRVERHFEVGRGPSDLFLLEILHLHLDERILVDGLPDPTRLSAIGRLGGASYCDTSVSYEIARPRE